MDSGRCRLADCHKEDEAQVRLFHFAPEECLWKPGAAAEDRAPTAWSEGFLGCR